MSLFHSRERRRRGLTLGLFALLPLGGCAGESGYAAEADLRYGTSVSLGEGTARTYVLSENGAPVELGVALSEAVMRGLPADHSPGGIPMPDGHHTFDHVLQMPEGNPTPFQFVGLGWNPEGHEPPGIWDEPHFDFHFYLQSVAERNAIVPTDPQWDAKAARYPAPEFLPQGYADAAKMMGMAPGKASVPLMGMHWVDPQTPELSGTRFTETMIFGSWDGEMTFIEPMVTKAYLESRPSFSAPLAHVEKYAEPGYYPTTQRIYWDEASREYRVALGGFVRK